VTNLCNHKGLKKYFNIKKNIFYIFTQHSCIFLLF